MNVQHTSLRCFRIRFHLSSLALNKKALSPDNEQNEIVQTKLQNTINRCLLMHGEGRVNSRRSSFGKKLTYILTLLLPQSVCQALPHPTHPHLPALTECLPSSASPNTSSTSCLHRVSAKLCLTPHIIALPFQSLYCVVLLSLSSRYHCSSVVTRKASLGPVELMLSLLSLYFLAGVQV